MGLVAWHVLEMNTFFLQHLCKSYFMLTPPPPHTLVTHSDDQLNSIAERTILEADKDGDQMISFEEFCSALERTEVEQKMSIKFLK